MPVFRSACNSCGGEVDIEPDHIALQVNEHESDEADEAGGQYAFVCPDCEAVVVKPADGQTIQLLRQGGVQPLGADTRPPHPEDPPGGDPLTLDDLLDFHQLLERDDWFDRLQAASGLD